jgi:L,D-transpeptidase YcbB
MVRVLLLLLMTGAAAAAPASPEPAAPAAPAASAAAAPAPSVSKPAPAKAPAFAPLSQDPRPTLHPDSFVATLRAADRYLQIAENGGWPALPATARLKRGDRGPLVDALKRRLVATEDLAPDLPRADAFDAAVEAAVRRFQARHGLPETGFVGARTVEALNVPAETRFRQLAASAQRLAGSRFPFGERYVVVNIPAAAVEAVEKGEVVRRYVAVAGKKDRPSPSVETRITNVNFNPTWTLPASIVKKDVIPQMRKDPGHLARMRIRILDANGLEVDPARIDWTTQRAADFTLRQDPGAANSLGRVRIDMPNRHAVYLHDTPAQRLFARADRFHSSGCVRVGDVRGFVAWLLDGAIGPNGPWSAADIDAAIAAGERLDVKLPKPVPVAWVYLTGYAGSDGTVHFRDDVYGLDRADPPPLPPDAAVTSALPR